MEPSTNPVVLGQPDPINEGPEEDPEFARYFADGVNHGAGENPSGFTGGFEIDCTALTMDVNGTWARGALQGLDTYGSFWAASEFHSADTDLSTIPGATETTETNLGGGFNGTHNDTVTYDNLLGTSYQFTVKNGTLGPDQDGLTFHVPPQQCNEPLPNLGAFSHDENEFQVEVSQGQCSIDNTTISLISDDPVDGSDVLEVFLVNAETGLVVKTYEEADFFDGPDFQYFFLSDSIPTGDWVVLAALDAQGLGSNDRFDTAAFNVKEGPCTKTTIDDTTFIINQNIQELFLGELEEHRNHTLEVMGMDFEALGFDGFLVFLFFCVIFAITLWQGWDLPMLISSVGVVTSFFPAPPVAFVGLVFMLVVAFWIEYFLGGLRGIKTRVNKGWGQ